MSRIIFVAVVLGCGCVLPAHAEEDDPRPAKGIQDNSFLIEEAYNQEPGVVQSIATFRRQQRDWAFNFVQEMPIGSQTHQFSYSVPYAWLLQDGRRVQGFGDVMLNYRYQVFTETAHRPAFAARFSLILPTGNRNIGTGEGSLGYQINLPASKIVTDRVTLHGNAGMTSFFDVYGRVPVSFHLGGSSVYAVTRNFNVLLEALAEWKQTANPMREIEREFTFTLSPGARYAWNFPAGQLVAGVAAPISFTRGSAPSYGGLLYLSFENAPPK